MVRYDDYGYTRRRRGSTVLWIFLGIITFATLYYPFFGGNLRFKIGNFVSTILTTIGTFFLIVGIFLLVIGFIAMFISGAKGLTIALYGFLFIVLALCLIEPGNFGFFSHGGKPVPKGYH